MANILVEPAFDYPTLTRKEKQGSRLYQLPDGSAVPSVTTILSATKPKEDREVLLNWKKRVGDTEANKQTKEASSLGTLLHDYIEAIIYNKVEESRAHNANNLIHIMARKQAELMFTNGISTLDAIIGSESNLYYEGLYAGTADLIGIRDNKFIIGDFKNSKKIKKEEWITDYYLQGCAYASAINKMYGIDCNTVLIWMVDRQMQFKEFEITGSKFDQYAAMWNERVAQYFNITGL